MAETRTKLDRPLDAESLVLESSFGPAIQTPRLGQVWSIFVLTYSRYLPSSCSRCATACGGVALHQCSALAPRGISKSSSHPRRPPGTVQRRGRGSRPHSRVTVRHNTAQQRPPVQHGHSVLFVQGGGTPAASIGQWARSAGPATAGHGQEAEQASKSSAGKKETAGSSTTQQKASSTAHHGVSGRVRHLPSSSDSQGDPATYLRRDERQPEEALCG